MSYNLSDRQFESIQKLPDHERYDYFLKKVARWEQIWSLHSPQGWVELSSTDGEECLPIWPHPDFAKIWAVDDWSDCQPKAINLELWLQRWTAGLERDNTVLVVFPVDEEKGLVVTPAELEEAILVELEQE